MGPPILLMLALAAVAAFEWVGAFPEMPPSMASTFGHSGAAVGWMGRGAFFTVMGVTFGLWIALFAGLARLVARLPPSLVNLPHRDHWLATERRAETVAYLERWIAWTGAGGMLFLAWVTHQVIEANRLSPPRLTVGFGWVLGGSMTLLGWWLWRLWRRFGSPGDVAGGA